MTDKKSPTFIKILTSLTPLDRDIVQEEAALSDATFSATLRKIIREWAHQKDEHAQDEQPAK